jgi:hypothetical protein
LGRHRAGFEPGLDPMEQWLRLDEGLLRLLRSANPTIGLVSKLKCVVGLRLPFIMNQRLAL